MKASNATSLNGPAQRGLFGSFLGATVLVLALRSGSPYLPVQLPEVAVPIGLMLLLLSIVRPGAYWRTSDTVLAIFASIVSAVTLSTAESVAPVLATWACAGFFVGVRALALSDAEWTERTLTIAAVATVGLSLYSILAPRYDYVGVQQFFAGGKNSVTLAMLVAAASLDLLWAPSDSRARIVRTCMRVAAVSVLVLSGSGTGLVVALAILVIPMMPNGTFRRWTVWWTSILVVNAVIVSGWLVRNSLKFREVLQDELNKGSNFTGRDGIWDIAIAKAIGNPLGYGRGSSVISNMAGGGISEAHNAFLEAWLAGGWIGLTAFVVFSAVVAREASRSIRPRGVAYVWVGFMAGVVESVTFDVDFYVLLAIATLSFAPSDDRVNSVKRTYSGLQPRPRT